MDSIVFYDTSIALCCFLIVASKERFSFLFLTYVTVCFWWLLYYTKFMANVLFASFVFIYTQVMWYEKEGHTEKENNKRKIVFSILCFYYYFIFLCWFLFGDRVLVTIQVRRRRYFIVLRFTVVSHCILGDRRRGNLEHWRRVGESV